MDESSESDEAETKLKKKRKVKKLEKRAQQTKKRDVLYQMRKNKLFDLEA